MLYLVATPIGDASEITLKALDVLRSADFIICESTKETGRLLRHHEISGKKFELLNEHTQKEELLRLVDLCASNTVALVSDCGTPAFFDPGADLVELCRRKDIVVKNCLGASSLMGLISLSGVKLKEFVFRGFLSQETEQRDKEWEDIKRELQTQKRPYVIMDTPYRLLKTLKDLETHFFSHDIILAMNLGTDDEMVIRSRASQMQNNHLPKKAEFILLLLP